MLELWSPSWPTTDGAMSGFRENVGLLWQNKFVGLLVCCTLHNICKMPDCDSRLLQARKGRVHDVIERSRKATSEDIISERSNFEYLPTSLCNLLCQLISIKNNDLVVATIGESVLQSAHPRTLLAPLQIDLALQLDMFDSCFLITSLNQLRFCLSYAEVQKMELNAVPRCNESWRLQS